METPTNEHLLICPAAVASSTAAMAVSVLAFAKALRLRVQRSILARNAEKNKAAAATMAAPAGQNDTRRVCDVSDPARQVRWRDEGCVRGRVDGLLRQMPPSAAAGRRAFNRPATRKKKRMAQDVRHQFSKGVFHGSTAARHMHRTRRAGDGFGRGARCDP